jgi:Tol biopolymer transport system component
MKHGMGLRAPDMRCLLALGGALGLLGLGLAMPGCGKERPVTANTKETVLTSGPGVRIRPIYSPDGRWLAYTDASDLDHPTVFVMASGGGQPSRLVPAGSSARALEWTADSQGVVVWFPVEFRIRVFKLNGDILREMPAVPMAKFEDISADGNRYLWCKLNGDSYDAGLVQVDQDSVWHALEETPEWETDACFGPGANDITLVRQASFTSPTSELGVFSTVQHSWTPLPLPKAHNQEPIWDPGKRLLAFISDRAGSNDLWIYDAKETRLVQVTSGPEDEANPAWSPDGSTVAFTRKVTSSHVFVGDPRTYARTQITSGEARDQSPRGSPDGRWVAFFRKLPPTGKGPAPAQLCVIPAAGGAVNVLDTGGLLPTSGEWMCAWSPDAANLVFAADDGTGNVDLYRMPRDGGHPDRITITPGLDVIPDWSPDGKEIAYTRLAGGETQVWAIPATGGIPLELSRHEGVNQAPIWAPDSDHLAYLSTREAISEIHVTSLRRPEENRTLLATKDPALPVAWSAEGDLVFLLRENAKAWSIEAQPVNGSPGFRIAEGEGGANRFFAKFDPRYARYRERVYPGNVNVFVDGEQLANLVSIDVSRLLAAGLQAARD